MDELYHSIATIAEQNTQGNPEYFLVSIMTSS